jgi:hypothetical protein
MFTVPEILKRSCEKLNLKRIVFNDKKVPTSIENIIIFPFFGDTESSFILSSLLLKRIKEEAKGSKYFIVLSWPGNESLYSYVDEYWTIEDETALDNLRIKTDGFNNNSTYYTLLLKSLNEWFYEIFTSKDLIPFYNNGLTKSFFERFKNIKVHFPSINSSAFLGMDFAKHIAIKDLKVFIYPCSEINSWKMGKNEKIKIGKDFYIYLTKRLIEEGYYPVIYRDIFCHDISIDINQDCLHIWERNLSKVLAAIRSTGFVIDFFSGISKLSICARTPFLCFDERTRFNNSKGFEIDDLCGKDIYKDYIFSFATIISSEDKNNWKNNIVEPAIVKLGKIYPKLNRDLWPSTAESNNIVPYSFVRNNKNKKFGTRFIKINREEI